MIDANARGGFHHQVVSKRRGDPDADQPLSVAGFARRRIALVPAEAFRADAEALGQSTLRKGRMRIVFFFRNFRLWISRWGRRGIVGDNLRVVENAELNRIDAELFRHFIHRNFQRHHAGRLTRRAHRISFG